jgi:hypothetical protein
MAAIDQALVRIRQDGGSHLLRPERINQLARELGHGFRQTPLTPGNTLRLFVRQIACGNIACSAVRHLAGEDFSDSAWCQARSRLPMDLVRRVHEQVIQEAQRQLDLGDDLGDGPYRWHGHRLHVVDGTSDSMPDTPELREHYGVPSGCREQLGFPTSHLLLSMDHRSGLLVGCVDSPMTTSDLSQTPTVHQRLGQGDVLLGDDSFSSWGHLALILRATPLRRRITAASWTSRPGGRTRGRPRTRAAAARASRVHACSSGSARTINWSSASSRCISRLG